jgi:hypothetical protein
VEYKLELIWPVPVNHLIKYISYLSLVGFSVSTITTYKSGVSSSLYVLAVNSPTHRRPKNDKVNAVENIDAS